MNHKRPVNLDLASLKFPSTAIASILHRITGVALFVLMPVMLYLLNQSLHSEASFAELKIQLQYPGWKFILWSFSSALTYHLFAGIRHLLMDLGFGDHLAGARVTATGVIVLSILSSIYLGVSIW